MMRTPRWLPFAWNGLVIVVLALLLVQPIDVLVREIEATVRDENPETRKMGLHVVITTATYIVLFAAYALHATTLYSRRTLWRMGTLVSLAAAVAGGAALSVLSFLEISAGGFPSFWTFEWSCHAGPLVLLSLLVLITRKSALQMLVWSITRIWKRARAPSSTPGGAVFLAAAALSSLACAQDDWAGKEGRREIARIAEGKVGDALASLEARLEADPSRAEALFGLAVAYTQRGDIARAMDHVRRALEAGLPVERFLAGPRDLLAPLAESRDFQELVAARDVELIHGPLLGCVTDSSARFWVRAAREAPVRVRVRRFGAEPGDGETLSDAVTARAERDYTTVAEVRGLEPETTYEYRLLIDGRELETVHSFRTFPRPGAPSRFTVAFGGGAAYTPEYERVFSSVKARRPLAFLQLGDNVYIDAPETKSVQQYCYYRRQSSAPYRELVASTNVAAIWDDHDFGTNDCRGGPDPDRPEWKRAVWRTFRENWNNPAWGGGEAHPGCYFDFAIGDVHFILLDCRYYRSDPKAEAASMLGPVQKKWLLERLRSSPATFKVIASSVPFASGTKPGSRDTWDGYAAEREEIFSTIERERIEGVLLIAADRHRSDLWVIPRPSGYDLYELQSSRLTNIHSHPLLEGALFGFNADRSFGLLEFDTTVADPEVTLAIADSGGRTVDELRLRRSRLSFRQPAPPARRVLAFYYTWYGTPDGPSGRWVHWQEGGHDPSQRDARGWRDLGAANQPLVGPYDSHDPEVVRRHARENLESGIDGWISTWWGKGDAHDRALAALLEELEEMESPLAVSAYYETCHGRPEQAVSDLTYILERYGGHRNWLRHAGKPVVFIYSRAIHELPPARWIEVAREVQHDHACVLSADSDRADLIRAFGAGHGYNPVTRVLGGEDMGTYYRRFAELCRSQGAVSALTVIPGYDDRQVRSPGIFLPRRGGVTYADLWRAARRAGPDWILITSFNEWHEGTEIEPSREHGTFYLEATRRQALRFKEPEPAPLLKVSGRGAALRVDLEAAAPELAREVVALDHAKLDCAVIANLSSAPVPLRLGGLHAIAVALDASDDALEPPAARFAESLTERAPSRVLVLRPDEELHVWERTALERHIARGGYAGGGELRDRIERGEDLLVFSPQLEPDGRDRRLEAASGMTVPLAVRLRALAPLSDAERARAVEAASAGPEGPVRIRGDALVIEDGAPPGLYRLRVAAGKGADALAVEIAVEVVEPFAVELRVASGALEARAVPRVEWDVPGGVSFTLRARGGSASVRGRARRTGDGVFAASWPLGELAGRELDELVLERPGGELRREVLLAAELDFASPAAGRGLRHTGFDASGDGRTREVEKAGSRCRETVPFRGHPGYMYFDAGDAFVGRGDLEVTVDVLETGATWLVVQYDADEPSRPFGGAYNETPRRPLGTSGEWRTHTFRLPNAWFRGRQNSSADFRFHAGGTLCVGRVKVSCGGR